MRILENEALKVEVADKGAELCGVVDKATGTQRVWTADPTVWNRHAPILFPFVGKVVSGQYRVGGQTYPMPTQHGFARDMVFECTEASERRVAHALTSTDKTRASYPYDFRLEVVHALDAENPRTLNIRWLVENTGDDVMFYAIGGHPGFLLPEGVAKEDCHIAFPGCTDLTYFGVNAEGYALPQATHALTLENGLAKYQPDIPDTWIFAGQGIQTVGIALPDGTPYVTLRCEQFPMLAVWANPKGRFICLEPWFGRTDDAGFTGTIEQKAGIQRLEPHAAKEIAYSITFE